MSIEVQPRPPAQRRGEAPPQPALALRLDGVARSYRRPSAAALAALASISLEASEGEILALVGPSGCGKTTLLELVCRLQQPDAGTLRAAPAALMPQRDLLLPWLDAAENAALPLRIAGLKRREARSQAAAMFAQLGLGGFERVRPAELSGGMRQRVAFLRTLLSGKPLLCLDEPFGALDAITRAEMQLWLAATLTREPRTVLLVTHDVEEAVLLADRVLVLSPRPGRIVAELPVELARPRLPTDPEVTALRAALLESMKGGSA